MPKVTALVLGVVAALLVSSWGGPGRLWGQGARPATRPATSRTDNYASSPGPANSELDREPPQKQAEILLERAIGHSEEAPGTIMARLSSWRGKLTWDAQLSELTTAALNSRESEVRDSAIEVQLIAYGLDKNNSTAEALIRQAGSSDHAQAIWALWGLGLLANRGVETDRVVEALTTHLQDSSAPAPRPEDERVWAVEALGLAGINATIAPLLAAMHNDPSATVRERAACSLAQSGTMSRSQRWLALPQLIAFSDDPALDNQTHDWAFQALGDISGQRLPNNSEAWRNWFRDHGTAD